MIGARDILETALREVSAAGYQSKSPLNSDLKKIIDGKHLTFRYILVTAVLAKATDQSIHPRALQRQSTLIGAYDARSLCHGIVVPFERERLGNALGGSNEPFLNKPARFKEVSLSNAVRRGRDRALLEELYKILEAVNALEKHAAFDVLCDVLFLLQSKRLADQQKQELCRLEEHGGSTGVLEFIEEYCDQSMEGETCAVAVGALLRLLTPVLRPGFEVQVHPSNQSGASSREVSDIDVVCDGKIEYCVEAKDKVFRFEDVQHAASKVAEVGLRGLLFVRGPQGRFEGAEGSAAIGRLRCSNVDVAFFSVGELARFVVFFNPRIQLQAVYDEFLRVSRESRVKDRTMDHLLECARRAGFTPSSSALGGGEN